MKRFNDLTSAERSDAITYAVSELKECIEMGIVHFDKTISDELLVEYAICAAQDAWYVEAGDKVIHDIAE